MPAFADLNDKIKFFFDDPTKPPAAHKRRALVSVLYLLRRELIETAGYDPARGDDEAKVDTAGVKNRLFASLILMFTAFDLLAKFSLGDKGGVGECFKEFLESPHGAGMPRLVAELFYAVRNSLVHAFGTPDADSLQRLGMRTVAIERGKEIPPGRIPGLYTLSRNGDVAVIYVDGIFRTLFYTIGRYRQTLYGEGSDAARAEFEAMFDKYGKINWV
jgi:hypothetical protein